MPEHMPPLIYKVVTTELWRRAEERGVIEPMPIDARDGYVHLSAPEQLVETLRLHFAGRDDLVLLAVRTEDVAGNLKWEPSRGGDLFPHLYDELPLSALAWTAPVSVSANGEAKLPSDFQ